MAYQNGRTPPREPESFYESAPRQQHNEKAGGGGMRLTNNEPEYDDDRSDDSRHSMEKRPMKDAPLANPPPPYQANVLQMPRPGYPAPIAMLQPVAQGRGRMPVPIDTSRQYNASPAPSTPHPLQAPMTPITPIFARPNVQFAGQGTHIIRGHTEENILPQRGQKGDDFWRRFSMIANDEKAKPANKKQSSWLQGTLNKGAGYSKSVWVIGLVLLILVGGAIGLAFWAGHKKPDHQAPIAIGGSANELATQVVSSTAVVVNGVTAKASLHVSPTNVVPRQEAAPPLPTGDSPTKSSFGKDVIRRRHPGHSNTTKE